MNIPYRTRKALQNFAIFLLIMVLVAVMVLLVWLLWLDRYVVYNRSGDAVLDFSRSVEDLSGVEAIPPEDNNTVSIFYNDGSDAVNTSTELAQLYGYYVDAETLSEDFESVKAKIESLPPETAIMLDVRSNSGYFYYSSDVWSRSSSVDTAAMDELISYLSKSQHYIIARFPALRSRDYALDNVSLILKDEDGYGWQEDDDIYYWLDPSKAGVQDYLVKIIMELKVLGFDEVVLDDFYYPSSPDYVFEDDKTVAITSAAQTLVSSCATSTFGVSFSAPSGSFSGPMVGRSRQFYKDVSIASIDIIAQQSGVEDPVISLVLLTTAADTRFDEYSVLRPINSYHYEPDEA